METLSTHRCHGGTLTYFKHASTSTKCDMRFTAFVPPSPIGKTLIFLAGLTCTEENFTVKAGAYRYASELGLTIVAPDTSPRGENVPDEKDNIALGKGAGFYLNATEEPWRTHYQMQSYIAEELPSLIRHHFHAERLGLFGHSMGGHGVLTLAHKYLGLFESLSVFAPVCTPSQSGWGPKALEAYLGTDTSTWAAHDAVELMKKSGGTLPPILIDQGLADGAYKEGRLNPEALVEACKAVGQPYTYRTHEGYDHGYFFIQTFIEDHLKHHLAISISRA